MAYALSGTRRIADGGLSDRKDGYVPMGKITNTVARKAHIEPGNVVLSRNYKLHVANRHTKEITAFGFTPEDYVRFIVANFNRIYIGPNNSYLLTVYRQDAKLSHIAAVSIFYYDKEHVWMVRTAHPREREKLKAENLIWWKKEG